MSGQQLQHCVVFTHHWSSELQLLAQRHQPLLHTHTHTHASARVSTHSSLHHCPTRSLHYLLHHYITTSLHHYITTSLHHCITASLHHYITTSLHHYITHSPGRARRSPQSRAPASAEWRRARRVSEWRSGAGSSRKTPPPRSC